VKLISNRAGILLPAHYFLTLPIQTFRFNHPAVAIHALRRFWEATSH
jgi:hypothetical protein